MKKLFTLLSFSLYFAASAQTQITNSDFELWDNAGSSTEEPSSWNSNKTGAGLASSGPQTCFKETTSPHGGSSCVRVETMYYIIAVVNGNVTTGVVNAPSTDKTKGYIAATGTDKISFTGRPDSLVGYYKYTQATNGAGASAEVGKVYAVLHAADYYDPATPVSGNHPDLSANKIGDALFLTSATNTTTWKRFSVPFNYVNSSTPAFIMVNMTSSNNQTTTAPASGGTGSKLWVDDLQAIYNAPASVKENDFSKNVKVYYHHQTIYIDFINKSNEQSLLEIYDATGKLIQTENLQNNSANSIDVSGLTTGIYLYKVVGKSEGKFGKLLVD